MTTIDDLPDMTDEEIIKIYGSREAMDKFYEEIDRDIVHASETNAPRRAGWRSRYSIYPRAIVSANGYRTETVVDTYALREKQRNSGGVRRSRCGKGDPRKRFRVRMRAAARCNSSAAARWDEMKQIGQATHDVRMAKRRARVNVVMGPPR